MKAVNSEEPAISSVTYLGKPVFVNSAFDQTTTKSLPLTAPLENFELQLVAPLVANTNQATWYFGAILFAVLVMGAVGIYYIGLQQLLLARERSNFVSAITHELKTPLTSIRMYSELLIKGWTSGEEQRQNYYKYILTEAERLSRLIQNVLRLAGISSSTEGTPAKRVGVNDILRRLQESVGPHVEQAGFKLELSLLEGEHENVGIVADEDIVLQVLINLVDNALKFSRDTLNKVVEVGAALDSSLGDQSLVILKVRDFGPGIAETDRERIFELFYRGESELTRSTGGTGIGLALAQKLTESLGGELTFANSNPGAEFRATIRI